MSPVRIFGNPAISEMVDQRLEAVIDWPGRRETLRQDVPLLINLSELAEYLRADLARRIDASFIECAGAHCLPQLVEDDVSVRLGLDLPV